MISPTLLRSVKTIVTHDSCADGTASAVLLHDALTSAAIRFVQYGTDAHASLPAEEGMLFCDFSPPAARADEFVRAGAIVLDHHRTAKDIVLAMGDRGRFGDEATDPGVSGAVLAFRHVWLALRGESPSRAFAERFATVAGVRDTWQTKSPLWRESCAQSQVLGFFPREWWLKNDLAKLEAIWDEQVGWVGEMMCVRDDERVRRSIEGGYRFATRKGTRAIVLSGISVTSDAAEMLGAGVDVVIGFGYGVEDGVAKLRFSLRSRGDFDCAAFAKVHGGGGHTKAAGFGRVVEPSDPQPYRFVETLFAEV
jgi:hypothetical protein